MFKIGDFYRITKGYRQWKLDNYFGGNNYVGEGSLVFITDSVVLEDGTIGACVLLVNDEQWGAKVPIKFLQHDLISQQDYQRRNAPDFALKMATLVMEARGQFGGNCITVDTSDLLSLRNDCLDYARCIAGEKGWEKIHDYLTTFANWFTDIVRKRAEKGEV